jgi:hypothetical protein
MSAARLPRRSLFRRNIVIILFCCVVSLQEIRNMQNEELMGIRREEEMEMSDMEDTHNPDESGTHTHYTHT